MLLLPDTTFVIAEVLLWHHSHPFFIHWFFYHNISFTSSVISALPYRRCHILNKLFINIYTSSCLLDSKCSFLEESAVSTIIMVNHLPETVLETSLTNLSALPCTLSPHLTSCRRLSPFFVSHKELAGCRQCWGMTQQPAPPLDSPHQTSLAGHLTAQVPLFLFLVESSLFCISSGSLDHSTLFVAVWGRSAVLQWHKAAQYYWNVSSTPFLIGKLLCKGRLVGTYSVGVCT